MKRRKLAAITGIMLLAVLCAGFSCGVKDAAVAVNRYAESLSHLQDAEIIAHNQGTVDDARHAQILNAEKMAAKAGRELDAAIGIANTGGDPTQYVDAAQKAYDDLIVALKPTNDKALISLGDAAGALLKNAISLVRAVKPANGKPASPPAALFLTFLLSFGVIGMAVDLTGVLKLLNLVTALEPVGFDLLLKLAESLKGKTADEVLAMNEQLFGKIDSTADAELAKLNPAK